MFNAEHEKEYDAAYGVAERAGIRYFEYRNEHPSKKSAGVTDVDDVEARLGDEWYEAIRLRKIASEKLFNF